MYPHTKYTINIYTYDWNKILGNFWPDWLLLETKLLISLKLTIPFSKVSHSFTEEYILQAISVSILFQETVSLKARLSTGDLFNISFVMLKISSWLHRLWKYSCYAYQHTDWTIFISFGVYAKLFSIKIFIFLENTLGLTSEHIWSGFLFQSVLNQRLRFYKGSSQWC